MTRRLLAALAVLGLGAAACGGGGDPATSEATLRPIEPIIDEEPRFATGPDGVVTFTLGTSVDVACSIVFGEDETYGRLGTDNDMHGGAHADHRVTLGRLEPGTVVHYRLQGADAAGNLYRSRRDATFVVPEPGQGDLDSGDPRGPAADRENLARGAEVVEVSSELSEAFAAVNAVDGDPTTEWSTRGDGDDASVTIDLGEPAALSGVGFWTRSMSDGSAVVESITVTVDGEELGPFEVGRDLTVVDLEVTGQVVRFDAVATTGGNTGAVEIEVYGQ